MRFTADRRTLAEAIAKASAGVPRIPASALLAGMLVRAKGESTVELTAGDPSSLMLTATLDASVGEKGRALLPGKMLAEVSRYFTGDTVTVDADDDSAQVTWGKSSVRLAGGEAALYPAFPAAPAPAITLEGGAFCEAVRRVAPCTGDATPQTGSVCILCEGADLLMIATDGRRMSLARLPARGSLPGQLLIPPAALERFARGVSGEVSAGWDHKLASLTSGDLRLVSRVISGEFAKWRTVMAKIPQEWTALPCGEVTRAVKMAQLAAGEDDTVDLSFGNDELVISAAGQESSSAATVGVEWDKEPQSFRAGGKLLLDGMGESLEMGVSGMALFFRSGSHSYMLQSRRDLRKDNDEQGTRQAHPQAD